MPAPPASASAGPAAEPARRHRLSAGCFDAVARGTGDAIAVAELAAGQWTRTMLLLRALLDTAADHPEVPGPLPHPAEAWALLVRAERHRQDAVRQVVLYPAVGTWLSHCLRRLRGDEDGAPPTGPLWREVGHLHAVAASAALRAGIEFRATVPVRDGGVVLPTLGFAQAAVRDADVAEVRRDADGAAWVTVVGQDRVRLPADPTRDAPGWAGLRRLHLRHGGCACSPWLDDLDPYRNFLRPGPPRRLGDGEATHWRDQCRRAWALLASQRNVEPTGVAACLSSLVPVDYSAGAEPFSASSPAAYGGALLDRPTDPATLAASLVHEAQHVKLSALLDLVPLLEDGTEPVHYSPWRSDPRPLRGLFQGVYAFLGVAGFWHAYAASPTRPPRGTGAVPPQRNPAGPGESQETGRGESQETGRGERAFARFEFALCRAQTSIGLATLRRHARLTAEGDRFLKGVRERLTRWLTRPVPGGTRRAVDVVLADHRLAYRMSQLQPDPGAVAEWARAWLLRQPAPHHVPRVQARAAAGRWSAVRPALVRQRIRDPAGFRRLLVASGMAAVPDAPDGSDPSRTPGRSASGARAPVASAADLAWAVGDTEAARRGYHDRVLTDPDDIGAWVGLALSLPEGPARRALFDHPETLAATHRALREGPGSRPDPLDLAEWAGAGR